MPLCPYDLGWCERASCKTGICDLCSEHCLGACVACGELIEANRPPVVICAACVAAFGAAKEP